MRRGACTRRGPGRERWAGTGRRRCGGRDLAVRPLDLLSHTAAVFLGDAVRIALEQFDDGVSGPPAPFELGDNLVKRLRAGGRAQRPGG